MRTGGRGDRELRGLPLVGAIAAIVLVVPFLFTLRAGRGEFYPGAYVFFVLVAGIITALVLLVRWLMRKLRRRSRQESVRERPDRDGAR